MGMGAKNLSPTRFRQPLLTVMSICSRAISESTSMCLSETYLRIDPKRMSYSVNFLRSVSTLSNWFQLLLPNFFLPFSCSYFSAFNINTIWTDSVVACAWNVDKYPNMCLCIFDCYCYEKRRRRRRWRWSIQFYYIVLSIRTHVDKLGGEQKQFAPKLLW